MYGYHWTEIGFKFFRILFCIRTLLTFAGTLEVRRKNTLIDTELFVLRSVEIFQNNASINFSKHNC